MVEKTMGSFVMATPLYRGGKGGVFQAKGEKLRVDVANRILFMNWHGMQIAWRGSSAKPDCRAR